MYAIKRKNINTNSLKNENLYLYSWDLNQPDGYTGLDFRPISNNEKFNYCYFWYNIECAIEAIHFFNKIFNNKCPEMEITEI